MTTLTVTADGLLRAGDHVYPCALGKAGVTASKREGDHATPLGIYPLRRLFYRADRVAAPATGLPATAIGPADGWCDDPADPRYNQFVTLPYGGRTEALHRADALYDYILVIGYNDDPPLPGKGSAIFLHVATENYAGTQGCIALHADDLRAILPLLDASSRIVIREG